MALIFGTVKRPMELNLKLNKNHPMMWALNCCLNNGWFGKTLFAMVQAHKNGFDWHRVFLKVWWAL